METNEVMEEKNINQKKSEVVVIKKTTLYIIAIVLTLLYIVGFSIGVIITLNKEANEIANIKEQLSAMSSFATDNFDYVETLDIENMSYYKDLEINEEKYNEIIESKEETMLYFHSSTCSYCKEANVFIDKFISLGYSKAHPFYFVTPDSANAVFDKEKVESTPALLVIKADGERETFVGADEIFNYLDSIVEGN